MMTMMIRHLCNSRININHNSFKQQFNNLCTLVTYSAVTAVCLHPLAVLSFTPTLSASATTPHSASACPNAFGSFHTTNCQYSSSYHQRNYHIFLNLRGGASHTKKSQLNMVSTTSTDTNQSDGNTSTKSDDPKLTALRSKMKELGIDAFIIPSDDPHLSEYVPTAYMRRKFISGFGGSAGTAVVTQDEALLWTDSRYVFRTL